MGLFKPYGTPYTPKSFGMSDREFFLAVLRACPPGSTLHLDQDEGESWVRQLAEWSHRESPRQFEADYYRIDDRFVAAVEQVLAAEPSCLHELHHMCVMAADGRALMASVDNFSIITALDEQIRRVLTASKDE